MSFISNARSNSITSEQVEFIYGWVDQFPISRPKRSITRDFADGLNIAEISKACFPILVDLRHYNRGNSRQHHLENWATLNKKVFRPLGFEVDTSDVIDVIEGVPGAIEHVLLFIYHQFQSHAEETMAQQKIQRKRDTESALLHSSGNTMVSTGNIDIGFPSQHHVATSHINFTPRHSSSQNQYQSSFSNSHLSHYTSPSALSRASAVFPPFISASAAFSGAGSSSHSTYQEPHSRSRSRSRSRVPTTPTTRSVNQRQHTSKIDSRNASRTRDGSFLTSSSGTILTPAAAYQLDSFRGIAHSNVRQPTDVQTPVSQIRIDPAIPSSRVPFASTARGGALSFSAETHGESYNTFTAPQYMTGGVGGMASSNRIGLKGTLNSIPTLNEQSSISGRGRVAKPKSIAYSILAKNQIAKYPSKSQTLPNLVSSTPSFEPFQSLRNTSSNKDIEHHEGNEIRSNEVTPMIAKVEEGKKDEKREMIEEQDKKQEALTSEAEIRRLTLRVKLLESQIEDYKEIITIKDTQFARLVHILRSGKSESGPFESGPMTLGNQNDDAQVNPQKNQSPTKANTTKNNSKEMQLENPDIVSNQVKSFISPGHTQGILSTTIDRKKVLPGQLQESAQRQTEVGMDTPNQAISSISASTLVSGSISQIASRALERRQAQRHMEKLYTGGVHGALKSNDVTPQLADHMSIESENGHVAEYGHVTEYDGAKDEDDNDEGSVNLLYRDDDEALCNDLNYEYAQLNTYESEYDVPQYHYYNENGGNAHNNAYVNDEINDEENQVEHEYYFNHQRSHVQPNVNTYVNNGLKHHLQGRLFNPRQKKF